MSKYTINFSNIDINDISQVGGKNASLGEMFQKLSSKGINVPDGFATTSDAYWYFLDKNNIRQKLDVTLKKLDTKEFSNLHQIGIEARELILNAGIPEEIKMDIKKSYRDFSKRFSETIQLAVRSSATAEDLPNASFAGQQESYLNIRGEEELLEACLKCYASLFTDRAIKYRTDNGFEHMKVALSIGIQKMVRADKGSAGVGFTLDPETGFNNIILLTGSWGLGENIVQGAVNPDEFYIFKPSLENGKRAIINRKLGEKAKTLIYSEDYNSEKSGEISSTVNIETTLEQKNKFVLTDEEVEKLAGWCLTIEKHYKQPMDIEWAKDGIDGNIYIVQARPETIHGKIRKSYQYHNYILKEKSKILTSGKNIGEKIASGKARILHSPKEIEKFKNGEILVTEITNPDWDPVLKKASAIITNKGGRTSHAAIVARETGTVAVVGTGNATEVIKDGQEITVSCADGSKGTVFEGILKWTEEIIDTEKIKLPKTDVMLILADPDQAFKLSFLPNRGVGLMRLEFVINNSIQIHPMALVKFDQLKDINAKEQIETLTAGYLNKETYFIEKLSQAVATIAAAFYPYDVIVRMSDFKSNEYANLIGGREFEPHEENPMIGFRGASRYYNPRYKEGFELECKAMKIVREEMGLTNVKLMIPFCRTIREGQQVLEVMEEFGLKRGENGLEVYVMVEIPSNVILAKEFSEIFDGFSIGSNDLTQLTLGIDRDSEILSESFDENNDAVKRSIASVIKSARETGTKIGLCGQAPSDKPEFARFLVENCINSISFNPDALIKGIENIIEAEYH